MRDKTPVIRGRMRAGLVYDLERVVRRFTRGRYAFVPQTPWKNNLVLMEWAAIGVQLLAYGAQNYRISSMYLEFVNVASPGDLAPVPIYDRSAGSAIAYYNNLATSPSNDYLRVPMTAVTIGSADPVNFPLGNILTFFAQTSGLVGVHGKPFGNAHNSLVIGGALVATPNNNDATQDLIMSRTYLAQNQQQPKLATGQIGLEWTVALQ